jgi:hypothetical protein
MRGMSVCQPSAVVDSICSDHPDTETYDPYNPKPSMPCHLQCARRGINLVALRLGGRTVLPPRPDLGSWSSAPKTTGGRPAPPPRPASTSDPTRRRRGTIGHILKPIAWIVPVNCYHRKLSRLRLKPHLECAPSAHSRWALRTESRQLPI